MNKIKIINDLKTIENITIQDIIDLHKIVPGSKSGILISRDIRTVGELWHKIEEIQSMIRSLTIIIKE